jgi:GAF domain-containing protein/anti-sigma regulatory factor (Ser/Thr protein kinase)
MRRGTKPSKAKVESKRPAVPKSPKSEDAGVRDLEKRLAAALQRETEGLKREAEAQEQQAATAEILRVISSSPTDVQPVFDVIVRSAVRLCDGLFGSVFRFDGDLMHLAAHHNYAPTAHHALLEMLPMQPRLDSPLTAARAILTRAVVQFEDLEDADTAREYAPHVARAAGFRSGLAVPMLRDGNPLGAIFVAREQPGPFSAARIALLQTFADQAVIAIENVRLFNETKEALEQQTATSEILRVISSSPTDVEPVFDAIADRAAQLCEADDAEIYRVDGDVYRRVAHRGPVPIAGPVGEAYPISRGRPSSRAIVDRQTIHIHDQAAEIETKFPDLKTWHQVAGVRTILATPLLREGIALGVIVIRRTEVKPFSDKHIKLVQTFADQAVIAIENVRLFTELQEKNRALTEAHAQVSEALEQQTATAEVLKVISRSTFDLQPVLDTLVENATKLCDGSYGAIFRFDGTVFRMTASYGVSPQFREVWRGRELRPGRGSVVGRVGLEHQPVHVLDVLADPEYQGAEIQRIAGFRTVMGIPMLRESMLIGAFFIWRNEVRAFTDKQIGLVTTFADQAVIAIENVRLFTETKDALERQTATSEILQVISQSPTDTQPVFEAIVERALRLSEATAGAVTSFDGELIHVVASNLAPDSPILRVFPMRPSRTGSLAARTVFERQIIHVPDVLTEPGYNVSQQAAESGYRSVLSVPMMREGSVLGTITVGRSQAGPYLDRQVELLKTFADQAVIAIENVRLFTELQASNRDLTTALDTQTATSDILRVISRSQTDVQPVFDAIVASAARLLRADTGTLTRIAGDQIELAARRSTDDAGDANLRALYPQSLHSEGTHAQAIRDRAPLTTADASTDPRLSEAARAFARVRGYRSLAVVPLLRHAEAIGAIGVTRREPGGFTDDEITLLQTFADQAVIAIENVRLFTELQEKNRALTQAHAQVIETLDRQTATSEILRVISSSPTDVQPTFEAIAASAAKLCEAGDSAVFRFEAGLIHLMAHYDPTGIRGDVIRQMFPIPPGRGSVTARAILTRATVHIPDIAEDPEYKQSAVVKAGFRSVLSVPILRDDQPFGALTVSRRGVKPFSDAHLTLLQTFADQAVIAIENVRLFKELEARNKDLTEALEQQTATSEILSVISSSPTDVQPIFDTIVRSAARLCDATVSGLARFDGNVLDIAATYGYEPDALEYLRRAHPRRPGRDTGWGRAVLERRVIHVHDVTLDTEYRHSAIGYRTLLAVPLLREQTALGAIAIWRREVKPFSDQQIALVETFANQAVIAIENVRLFAELQARTHELTRSVGQLTALAEVGRAVSSTLDLETVLTTIVSRAVQLADLEAGAIYEYDEAAEVFHLRATQNLPEEFLEIARPLALPKGEGATGRLAVTREPVQIPDIAAPNAYHGRMRDVLLRMGHRALLAVPLISEDHIVGGLVVNRRQPGNFTAEVIELLRTLATQSALAIQNARLFREIEQKSRELEAASRHKSEFLANMSHELRTPLNAVIGFSEVLSERMFGELNDKQDEYLKDIHASGQHLLSLINDILDLSKIEAGRMELEVTDFDLPMTIDNALMLVRERAARRSIALHTAVDERLGKVQADERKIRQVLLNLLSNAIKFTPEGGRIDVHAIPRDGVVEVSVSDTGVGIAPEDQEAVFEEFRQVGTADKKVEGTGLGLALSRKFIELHGGRIWVRSQVGEGSTFTFTVPVSRGG